MKEDEDYQKFKRLVIELEKRIRLKMAYKVQLKSTYSTYKDDAIRELRSNKEIWY